MGHDFLNVQFCIFFIGLPYFSQAVELPSKLFNFALFSQFVISYIFFFFSDFIALLLVCDLKFESLPKVHEHIVLNHEALLEEFLNKVSNKQQSAVSAYVSPNGLHPTYIANNVLLY